MGITAAIANYFILLPMFEVFMPINQLIESFGMFLPFINILDIFLKILVGPSNAKFFCCKANLGYFFRGLHYNCTIGVVAPVYGHEAPPMVKEFLEKGAFFQRSRIQTVLHTNSSLTA